MNDALRMAVGTLTTLPVQAPRRVDRSVSGAAMLAAPLAGLLLGAAVGATVAAGSLLDAPALLTATAAVGVLALASRGLHLDGLADTADGLGASVDRGRALEVMRRGDVGPFGAATLVLVLLAQVAALAALVAPRSWWQAGLVAAGCVVASRAVLPLVCAGPWPAARPDGLGAAVAGSVRTGPAGLATLLVLVLLGLAGAAGGAAPWVLPVSAAVGWVAALLLVTRVARRLGGTTGDVLGAAVETALVGVLASATVWG